ncbi:tyrosine-type recombinase/integrase [Leifsonia sp. NPDC056665]|uniref:tyrosine-type recombinase/integrase n=1 Tax=Leifsonia sp. NPDC056665 TaxID=3345901 RepID=UPI00367BA9BC
MIPATSCAPSSWRQRRRGWLPPWACTPFRYSAASTMLAGGIPLKVVSEILGHSSVSITGDIYRHVSPEVSATAMDYLSTAFA